MGMKVERPGVRAGYDEWSRTYDQTPNPLVALDRRHTMRLLRPRRGERILDAGCGTGANLRVLLHAGSEPMGVDLSRGMLTVARRTLAAVPLAQANLDDGLPVRPNAFDGILCALVGEHLDAPPRFFRDAHQALLPGGRLVFSVFHPEMAAAGVEANFERSGIEYRLGANRHSIDDYLAAAEMPGSIACGRMSSQATTPSLPRCPPHESTSGSACCWSSKRSGPPDPGPAGHHQ